MGGADIHEANEDAIDLKDRSLEEACSDLTKLIARISGPDMEDSIKAMRYNGFLATYSNGYKRLAETHGKERAHHLALKPVIRALKGKLDSYNRAKDAIKSLKYDSFYIKFPDKVYVPLCYMEGTTKRNDIKMGLKERESIGQFTEKFKDNFVNPPKSFGSKSAPNRLSEEVDLLINKINKPRI